MKVGILGGGQLGRMIAMAGLPLGVRCRVLDPSPKSPASLVAEQITGEYEDFAALAEFVAGLDSVTYEFENVPVSAARWLAERVPVFPPPEALEIAQDRLHEKSFFASLGAAVPRFAAIDTRADLERAIEHVKLPGVLKTRRFGYDGKGQLRLLNQEDVERAWQTLGGRPLILEQLIPFEREVSLLAVRDRRGATAFYPLVENVHRDGILRTSRTSPLPDPLQRDAEEIGRAALDRLNYVGVLAIEFFVVAGRLHVNEMAPRVHNSGHWSIEGAVTSQFENHLRAVVGWPTGESAATCFAGMVNIIGDLPTTNAVLAVPGAHLHLYGKAPRANRKTGHVTVLAASENELSARIEALRQINDE